MEISAGFYALGFQALSGKMKESARLKGGIKRYII